MCKGFFGLQSPCGSDCRGTVAYHQTISKLFAEPYLPVNSDKLVEIGNDKGKLAFNDSERSCKAVEPLAQLETEFVTGHLHINSLSSMDIYSQTSKNFSVLNVTPVTKR